MTITTHGRDVLNSPEHGYDFSEKGIGRLVTSWALRSASKVITTSPTTERATFALAPSSKRVLITQGVNRHWIDQFPVPAEGSAMVFVGDPFPRKGFSLLEKARNSSPRLKRVRLLAVGISSGDDPTTEYLGYVDRRVLANIFQRGKCLVFPSFLEAFGIVVLEALAAGLPVVGSRTGIIELLEKDRVLCDCVYSFAPGDEKELAQKLCECLDDEYCVDLESIQQRLRSRYAWEAIADRTVAVYKSLL